MQIQSLDRKDLLEEGMAIHSSILPEESHGQKSLVDNYSQGCKESNMTEETYTQTHTHKGTKQSESHAFCCLQLLCISPFPFYNVRVKPCHFSQTSVSFPFWPPVFFRLSGLKRTCNKIVQFSFKESPCSPYLKP